MKNNILLASKNIYFVGIKGVGMTALAEILKKRGKEISGSDTEEKFFTDQVLKKLKIPYKEGFDAKNLPKKSNLIIYSTAFSLKSHPELIAAKKLGYPLLSYPEALSALFNNSLGIAISGTHGKTTTSALIAQTLNHLKLDLTALIGSRVNNWGSNALVRGKTNEKSFFVIEADEHQNKLRFYDPWSIVLTNVDYDHPDFYKSEKDYYEAFKNWVGKWEKRKTALPKIGVFNGDDPKTKRLLRELKLNKAKNCFVLTYGKGVKNDIRITTYKSQITSEDKIKNTVKIELNLPESKRKKINILTPLVGEHNAYNLAAAYSFILGLQKLNIKKYSSLTPDKIAKSLASFTGTERRMQFKGKKKNVLVFDDYGHHPNELRATFLSAKKAFPKHEIFAIFQPHTFTRTVAFLKEFIAALKIVDRVGLLEIYGSARENKGKISSFDIQKALNKSCKNKCYLFPKHEDCIKFLKKYDFKKPTVLITIGAGDGWRVGEGFLID